MKLFIAILFVYSHLAIAFTLSESRGRYFSNNEIDIIISPTDCSGAGFTTSEFSSMVKAAVKDFWNAVPTSSLYLDVKGIDNNYDIDGMTHTTALDTLVPAKTIVAGCNDDADDFDNANILGSALLDCSSGACKAVLILNANNSSLNTMSTSEVEAVIAHEIGHAFGLGHSEYQFNLMYYSTGSKTQKWLGQDDINGVSYLYPHEAQLGCLLGSLGTISLNKDDDDFGDFPRFFILSFIFTLLAGFVFRKYHLRVHHS